MMFNYMIKKMPLSIFLLVPQTQQGCVCEAEEAEQTVTNTITASSSRSAVVTP